MDTIAQVTLLIGIVCVVVMGVSLRGGNFIITALSLLLYLAFQRHDGTLSSVHENILKQIPSTVEEALARFNLTCKTTPCATCTCHCTYAPTYRAGSTLPVYPEHCTHYPKPESQCQEPLLDTRPNGEHHPKKTFMYHDFNDYVANLLTRGDIESMMDQACDDLSRSHSSPPPHFVHHPFEARFLREFGGPEPGKLFVDRGDEGRYAFALHVDFFNPEGMKVRGASVSSGIISMACLNLPLDIRYKPENLYLAAIIPGPKQPSLENLNHYIRPLMQDLAVSWERGVWYSKTANFPRGRLTRSAIALAVCDLPAARHLSALASVGSHFICSACSCYHKTNYGRVDYKNWIPHDKERLREYAELWRDAATSGERNRLFKEHGVRWSELWRLPYWDPARQLVVDSMHCILKGLVQHHVRTLLGLTNEKASPGTASTPAFNYDFPPIDFSALSTPMTMKELTQVSVINALLVAQVPSSDDDADVDEFMEQLQENLHRKNLHSLQYVCRGLDCTPTKRTRLYKADYMKALVHWVSSPPFPYLSYCPTENISSDVRSPYQPLHWMFAMSWTQAQCS